MDGADEKLRIDIDVRDDGIYLLLDNTLGDRITRSEIVGILEELQLQDIDFQAVNVAISQSFEKMEFKITADKRFVKKNEKISFEVTKDRLKAYAMFHKPGLKGDRLTQGEIKSALETEKIVFGISESALNELCSNREYGVKYEIAVGRPPRNGKNGRLEFYFDTSPVNLKPKELENGGVDFKDLQLFESASMGQELVKIVHPDPGENGIDVYGRILSFIPGRPGQPLPRGKNTEIDSSGDMLIASCAGKIIYADKKVSIDPVLNIETDVGPETGNIQFVGAVSIKGNVMSNFSVIADGSIEIGGVVEGATIRSKAGILISGGIQGMGKAYINAGIDLCAKFAENATLISGGNMSLETALYCDVKCDGKLELVGRRGAIVGGMVVVADKITARNIGSVMATPTNITVGNPPELITRYKELIEEFNQLAEEYKKISYIADSLTALEQNRQLPAEKKETLLKALKTKVLIRSKVKEAQNIIDTKYKARLLSNPGQIIVDEYIRTGVKITMGEYTMDVRDEIYSSLLKYEGGRIVAIPLYK